MSAASPRGAALAPLRHFWDYPRLGLCVKGLIAMRAIHLLIGCILGLGAVATAAAAGTGSGAETADASNCAPPGLPASGARDSTSPGGDVMGISHEPTQSASASSGKSGDSGDIHSGGDSVSPPRQPHASLGWQSLLPGSIQ